MTNETNVNSNPEIALPILEVAIKKDYDIYALITHPNEVVKVRNVVNYFEVMGYPELTPEVVNKWNELGIRTDSIVATDWININYETVSWLTINIDGEIKTYVCTKEPMHHFITYLAFLFLNSSTVPLPPAPLPKVIA